MALQATFSPRAVLSGTLYCIAHRSPTVLVSTSSIVSAGFFSNYVVNRETATVTINTGLNALTLYNVYCYIENVLGNGNTLAEARATKLGVTTACCHTLSFTTAPFYVFATSDKAAGYPWSYALSAAPASAITITPKITFANGTAVSDAALSTRPRSTNFVAGASLLQSSFIFISSIDNFGGKFKVTMQYTGASKDEYFAVSKDFEVLAAAAIRPAPILLSAKFTDSGAAIIFVFDSATSRAGLGTSFWKCNEIFTYDGASSATCVWVSSTIVRATFGAFVSGTVFASIGDNIALVANKLTAECPVGGACSEYPFAPSQSVVAEGPANPIAPNVIITMFSVVTYCDNVTVDSTLSSGHGSRDWDSVVWTVTSSQSTTAIEDYLNNFGVFIRQAISIPNTLFEGDTQYTISLEVTNFLGVTRSGSEAIFIDSRKNLPLLSIQQSKFVSIQPSHALSIFSSVRRSACAEAYSISYVWSMKDFAGQAVSIVQTSKDPTELLLAPYSLTGGEVYFAIVTATASATNTSAAVSSSVSIEVRVRLGDVITLIAGGAVRNVLTSKPVSIDASGTYDSNTIAKSGENVTVSWSCSYKNVDKFGETCVTSTGTTLVPSGFSGKILTFSGSSLVQNDIYLFIAIGQTADERVSSANTTIVPLPSSVTTEVTISSTIQKVNFDEKLEMVGTLTATYGLTATWSASID